MSAGVNIAYWELAAFAKLRYTLKRKIGLIHGCFIPKKIRLLTLNRFKEF